MTGKGERKEEGEEEEEEDRRRRGRRRGCRVVSRLAGGPARRRKEGGALGEEAVEGQRSGVERERVGRRGVGSSGWFELRFPSC